MDGWQICRFTSCTKSTHMCRVSTQITPYSSQNIIDLKTDSLPNTSSHAAERNNGGTCIRWTPRSHMGSMKSLSVSPWYVGHTYLMRLRPLWFHTLAHLPGSRFFIFEQTAVCWSLDITWCASALSIRSDYKWECAGDGFVLHALPSIWVFLFWYRCHWSLAW